VVIPVFSQPAEKPPEEPKAQPAQATDSKLKDPTSMDEAKALFMEAWELEQQQKYEEAFARYSIVLSYFQKYAGKEVNPYIMVVLNNMSGILVNQGKYQEAIANFKAALEIAVKMDNYKAIAEFYHKLGILYSQFASVEAQKAQIRQTLTPDGKKIQQLQRILLNRGTYVRTSQTDEESGDERIRVSGSQNPFMQQKDLYNKLVNLKVTGDFAPSELMMPDSVTFVVQIEKKGYFKVSRLKNLLPEMEYAEIDEKMVAIPRQVEAQITEDFYRSGLISPDEITLSPMEDKTPGKPIAISDKEKFKPGYYRLAIRKRGYEPIVEQLVINPGEGSFIFSRELKSSLRPIVYKIQGDFTAQGTGQITPDEISLNAQLIGDNSKMRPGEYKLLIRKEGYEPVIRTITMEPDERPYSITEFMKSLPREVIFQITGDYQKEELINPDEVTFNSRVIKYSDSVKPDSYRVMIRKKGYDPDASMIIVEPKGEPYILKKMLNSTPRRIQLELQAEFPAGLKLTPDSCTLNGKDATGDQSFKPGEYELAIKRSGYENVVKKVRIAPDDIPYLIRETLKAKPVQIELDITLDIAHDDPTVKPILTLINEKSKESQILKNGDRVAPESYLLKVEMDGFESEISKELILPSEAPYKIVKRLQSSRRNVITRITSEYPEGEIVVPDEITLDSKPIGKDFKAKPGVHDLLILKDGYVPVKKQINIGANASDFLLMERLETKIRTVNFVFRDSLLRKELAPEEVTFGNSQLTAKTIQIKPGQYNLKSRLKGYNPIDENVVIPVGSEPHTVERFMVAVQREVITEITGDFEPGKKLTPDIMTLNETPIGEKTTIRPGEFNLVIQKEGYFPVIEKLNILPAPDVYEIKRVMQSRPRAITLVIKSSFDDSKLTPNLVTLNEQPIKDGQELKPGVYNLAIKHTGYNPITEQITIPPSSKPFILEKTLEAVPVMVQYEIKSDYDDKPVAPELIVLNDKPVDQKTTFMPGKYTMKIEKTGYTPKKKDIVIQPTDLSYIIKEILETLPRDIDLKITGDFPAGQTIDPEIITLNGKDVRSNSFKPGPYQLDIQMPGYQPIKENVQMEPGAELYYIERMMVTKPRLVKERILYDVPPTEDLAPYKMTIALADTPKAERPIKDGDMLKPNSYIVRISKEAYDDIESKKYVWPAEDPIVLDYTLAAKQVLLKININHDIEPPPTLEPFVVSLVDKAGTAARTVSDGNRIKPGSYFLDITRPGYNGGPRQDIYIKPSERPYLIERNLIAEPRQLSFDMLDEAGILRQAKEILVNGKKVEFKDTFLPGTELEMIAKFKDFKTVQKRTKIIPGKGPFIEKMPLIPLVKHEFNIPKNEEVIDGIKYPYVFFADSQLIEEHHIDEQKGVGRIYYEVRVDPQAKSLQVSAGYFYTSKPFPQLRLGLGRLSGIYITKFHPKSVGLIEHLENKSKGETGRREALEIIERLVRNTATRSLIKQAGPQEIDQLVQYLKSWTDLPDQGDRNRLKGVIDILEGLKS